MFILIEIFIQHYFKISKYLFNKNHFKKYNIIKNIVKNMI